MLNDNSEERWADLLDYPGYRVSDHGRVLSTKTDGILRPTKKATGYRMVGLMINGIQHKRSLPLLVARAFLPRPPFDTFDTPIHLDGDRDNCHYLNLTWRPLWFARRYMRQFEDENPAFDFPIEDVETGELYKNSRHAAINHGLLDKEIRQSMLENSYVWPTGQVFRAQVNR